MRKAAAITAAAAPVPLCVQCNERPRLAALTRCRECVRAAAAVDRETRLAAEARISQKEQRLAALEALGDAMLSFARTEEGARFLERQQAELIAPRGSNDPEHVATALERDKQRETAANAIATIHHYVEHGRSRAEVVFSNVRAHAKNREASMIAGQLFEAKVVYHEDPHDLTKAADTAQKQPPRHSFGREKRSLPSGRRK